MQGVVSETTIEAAAATAGVLTISELTLVANSLFTPSSDIANVSDTAALSGILNLSVQITAFAAAEALSLELEIPMSPT